MRRARLVGRSFGRSLRRAAHNARRACSALSLAPSAPVAHTGAEGNALAAGQGCRTGSAPGKKRTTLTAASQGTVVFCKQNLHLALRAPLTAGFQCGRKKEVESALDTIRNNSRNFTGKAHYKANRAKKKSHFNLELLCNKT